MAIYHKKYSYRVEIDGLPTASFRSAGPLQANVGVVEEHEGGALAPTKEHGKTSFENITLAKGVTDSRELWSWAKKSIQGTDDSKKDLDIVQTDRSGAEVKRWNIFDAFPVRFLAGEWDAETEENVVEELELAIQSFDLAY